MHPGPRHEDPVKFYCYGYINAYLCRYTYITESFIWFRAETGKTCPHVSAHPSCTCLAFLHDVSLGTCLSLTALYMGSVQHACFSGSPPLSPHWSPCSEHSRPSTAPAQSVHSFFLPSEDSGLTIGLLDGGSSDCRLYTQKHKKKNTYDSYLLQTFPHNSFVVVRAGWYNWRKNIYILYLKIVSNQ